MTRAAVAMAWCVAPMLLSGQQVAEPAQSSAIEALKVNPNRPSSSNSADVLAPGVLQWEYGFSKEWGADTDRQSALGGEVRFGVGRNVEFRWGGNSLINNTSATTYARGFGDQYFSGQIRLREESREAPALALSYAIKLPTADQSQGLGTGRVDHSWTFLASKEVRKITCDFNLGYQFVGRENTTGHNQNAIGILTF